MVLDSTITCSACGVANIETMLTHACQYFYECSVCGVLLRPKPRHYFVFCSCRSVPCPPIQQEGRDGCRQPVRFLACGVLVQGDVLKVAS